MDWNNFVKHFNASSHTNEIMTYDEIINSIESCEIYDEDEMDIFVDEISEAVGDLVLSVEQKEVLIEQLLLNVEQQPKRNFTSWSLIHFIEWLDEDGSTNYNLQVLQSLKRKPQYLTLLLANRIINALPETSPDKLVYKGMLKEIASNTNLEENIRNEAKEIYEYQLSR